MSAEFFTELSKGLGIGLPPEGGKWLHIGGKERAPGWTVLDISPGPHVDVVGDCADLSMLESNSCSVIYSSHVMEHLGYDKALPRALSECHRVLKAGGIFLVSVPNLEALSSLFIDESMTAEEQYSIMQVMYGGRVDEYDVHLAGFSFKILSKYLDDAGFVTMRRIGNFGLFQDASTVMFRNVPISLNVVAVK